MEKWAGDWETLLWWLAMVSILMFAGSLVAIPFFARRIPEDYFLSPKRSKTRWSTWPIYLQWLFIICKNVLGLILVLAGIAMLVLPGQGLLTIFVGLVLMNFPGKFTLERRIIHYAPIFRAINWIRQRQNIPPLRLEHRQ